MEGADNVFARMHMTAGQRQRLVVGMAGSSAPQLGIRLLEALAENDVVETHLVMTHGARLTIELEARRDPDDVAALAEVCYAPDNLAAAISSGSFAAMGMAIVPCSMKTLAGVASGYSADLVCRAADVCLKERRRLVLVPRETPLNLIHIRNFETVTLAGATILPPVPAFYHRPKSVDDILNHIVGKILDQFEIEHSLFRRWS